MGCRKLIIVPMQPEDIPEILHLEKDSFSPWNKGQLKNELDQETGFQFVGRLDGSAKIRAFVCGRIIFDEAEILRFNVARNLRQKGIGSQLLDFVLKFSNNNGAKNCFLELRASNTAARCLYEKKGFSITGTRKNYYGEPVEDAILMQRELKFFNQNSIVNQEGQ